MVHKSVLPHDIVGTDGYSSHSDLSLMTFTEPRVG